MKEKRFAWLIIPLFVALFLISVLSPFGDQKISQNGKQGPTIQKIQNLYQKDDQILKHTNEENHVTKQGHPKIFTVNSLQIGEEIVQRLDNSPEITHVHHNPSDTSHYYENQIIVKFHEELSDEQLKAHLTDIDGKLLNKMDSIYTFSSKGKTTVDLIQHFAPIDNVAYAEPNYIMMQNETTPNDLYYQRYQWNLPLIEAEAGWKITQGNDTVKIAVVDTGVDLEHPDLVKRLTTGFNALTESSDADDDNGHGTHVAGIIASEVNNHEGIAGLTWFNPIIPVKVMGEEGYGSTFDIAKGIIWATNQGARVINLSLGNYQHSDMLKDAIDYAFKRDVVLIAASGNDNTSQPSFPAAYPQVLSVAAVDYYGDRADFSNYGDYIDVSAPGVQIASTYFNKQYAALSGTSMAAPHVSALAGLIRSINPELRNKEVMEIIKNTTVDLGDKGKDIYFGEGLIDIVDALEVAAER